MLLYAEDQIEKHGIPQIDFLMYNDQAAEQGLLKNKEDPQSLRLRKF